MTADAWQELCAQMPPDASPHELDDAVAQFAMLDQDERAALWLFAWSRRARDHRAGRRRNIRPRPAPRPPWGLRAVSKPITVPGPTSPAPR